MKKTNESNEVNTSSEMNETDLTDAYYCPDCETLSRESGGPLYECDEGELESIAAVECPTCLELIATDDWDDHKLEHVTGGHD